MARCLPAGARDETHQVEGADTTTDDRVALSAGALLGRKGCFFRGRLLGEKGIFSSADPTITLTTPVNITGRRPPPKTSTGHPDNTCSLDTAQRAHLGRLRQAHHQTGPIQRAADCSSHKRRLGPRAVHPAGYATRGHQRLGYSWRGQHARRPSTGARPSSRAVSLASGKTTQKPRPRPAASQFIVTPAVTWGKARRSAPPPTAAPRRSQRATKGKRPARLALPAPSNDEEDGDSPASAPAPTPVPTATPMAEPTPI